MTDLLAQLLGWAPLLLAGLAGTAYAWGAALERERRGWPARRTASFLAGTTLVVLALSPDVDAWADRDFAGHAAQHLLLAMLAPLLLVLGAPTTLLLRRLPHRAARRLGRLLHGPVGRVLAHPVPALVLSSGGLVVLYLTPLYELSTRHDLVHALVHVHLLAAGLLFTWAIAGHDPAAGRASVRARLVALGVAVAVHATLSQLLHAGVLVRVDEPAQEMRAAGSLMYFGGDLIELLLALALLATWRPAPRRPDTQVPHRSAGAV